MVFRAAVGCRSNDLGLVAIGRGTYSKSYANVSILNWVGASCTDRSQTNVYQNVLRRASLSNSFS